MKINAIIESKDGGTLVLDFPRSIYDVYETRKSWQMPFRGSQILHRVSIRLSEASQGPCGAKTSIGSGWSTSSSFGPSIGFGTLPHITRRSTCCPRIRTCLTEPMSASWQTGSTFPRSSSRAFRPRIIRSTARPEASAPEIPVLPLKIWQTRRSSAPIHSGLSSMPFLSPDTVCLCWR